MKSFPDLDDAGRALVRQGETASLPARPQQGRLRRHALPALVLALIWGALTDWRVDSVVFGGPAVLLGLWLLTLMPQGQRWQVAPVPAIRFAGWFAVQAFRGAVDVALRAVLPRMPLDPGFRSWRTGLPEGTPRIVLANAVSLLPGTLSAELEGQRLVIHLLDCRTDFTAETGRLEARIAAMFATSIDKESAS